MINLQDIAKNIKKMHKIHADILFSESMKKHTTFKVGGNANVFIIPHSSESLFLILQEIRRHNAPYFILGGGSNIVVSDKGLDCIVISTAKLNSIEMLSADDNENSIVIKCDAGCSIDDVTQFCIDHELSGLENFAGLPGSVGGALYMNARCYDSSISDVLCKAEFLNNSADTQVIAYAMNNEDWDYKKSPFQQDERIVLSAYFSVKKGNKDSIIDECNKYIQDRKDKGHFSHPSAGSVFKNNRAFGKASGQIIDSVGLKGYSIGEAQIAPWHGNFIINLGAASADNIRDIVKYVQKTVKSNAGYDLECEILFVGKFN